jgi:hypothetical protein
LLRFAGGEFVRTHPTASTIPQPNIDALAPEFDHATGTCIAGVNGQTTPKKIGLREPFSPVVAPLYFTPVALDMGYLPLSRFA